MKKLFMAFLAVATIAMVGCKDDKKDPTPTPTPGGGGDDPSELEIPDIAAPGAGKTTIAIYAKVCPKGAYLVGNFEDLDEAHKYNINYDGYTFEAVPDAENWYAATIVYTPDRAVKAVARPSTDAVPFSWSYQWGPNFDEAASTPLVPDEAHNNTLILKGDGEFEFENQGEVKLIGMAENAVVYVQVKNWKSSPIVEKQPLATAWAKTSWDGGSWTWREMTAKGNGVFEITGVWGGDGFNISATEAGAESWYPTDHANFDIQEGAKAGDEVKLTFTSEYGTVGQLKLEVINAGELTYKDITISAVVPAGWTKCYLYTWNAEGNQTGEWPGEELTITAGKVEKAFTHVAVPLNFIFNNGEGAQTTDQSTEENVADFDVESNLKP